jgi:hypothetical protein
MDNGRKEENGNDRSEKGLTSGRSISGSSPAFVFTGVTPAGIASRSV